MRSSTASGGPPDVGGLTARAKTWMALHHRDRIALSAKPVRNGGTCNTGTGNQHSHVISASFLASVKTSSSIAGVSLPVNMFCWLGW
jgi:hypothetical protein